VRVASLLAGILSSYACLAAVSVSEAAPETPRPDAAAPAAAEQDKAQFLFEQGSLVVVLPSEAGAPDRIVGRLALPGTKVAAVRRDNMLFVALSPTGIAIIDVADPQRPTEAAFIQERAVALALSAMGLIVKRTNGVSAVYDVSTPQRPFLRTEPGIPPDLRLVPMRRRDYGAVHPLISSGLAVTALGLVLTIPGGVMLNRYQCGECGVTAMSGMILTVFGGGHLLSGTSLITAGAIKQAIDYGRTPPRH
jgi:hypothetical protein